ncbi:hypothetical protein [Planktotalea sp.]|uniref:hypothetical protein n=1 Tax=Planktotalea sp. TaxID=2029877 RepID=UPI003D6B20DE
MTRFLLAGAFALIAGGASADISVSLGSPWDGKSVPKGQQCTLFGGKGSTPPMQVSGVPAGAAWIIAEFNDKSYQPLSRNGGHGIIAWPAKAGTTTLKSVPGLSAKLPHGAQVMKAARGTGRYKSAGYLPPCSGGRGNTYSVDIKVVNSAGKVIATEKNIKIGRY